MKVGKFRIAVATKADGGLEDVVSDVFGRAKTFTIVDVDKGIIENVKVLQNPAISYKHGAGPIVVKMLVDSGVNVVVAADLGPGALSLIEQHNMAKIAVKPGTSVEKSVKDTLLKIKKQQ